MICKSIKQFKRCNFLVFGMGHDSIFWKGMNRRGRTVFLENNAEWYQKVLSQTPDLEAYLITYPHNITQWQELLEKPEELLFKLPEKIDKIAWDVILVDAPPGWDNSDIRQPGRMSSIYTASKIIKDNGHIIVHDCERKVEQVYTDRYLGDENLIAQATGRALLKVYKKNSRNGN